ncbi:MAG: hypothetical protein ACOYB1_05715 [Limnohabitans sp.]
MKFGLRQSLETAALISVSALLFIVFFTVNGLIFSRMEYRHGVNWIFLPAGFRVILILVMGIPASMGIMLGTWFIDRAALESGQASIVWLNSIVSGFTPWVIMKALEKYGQLSAHLRQFSSAQLLNFTLIYGAANAVLHQLGWWLLDPASVNPWVDIWPMFVGDVLGALIMLYAFKGILSLFKPATQPSNSDGL